MKTEEEFEEYKRLLDKTRLKQARKTASVFGVLAITALIALVYAFFQQTAANKSRLQAEIGLIRSNMEIKQLKNRFEQNAEEAKKQFDRAEDALKQLDHCKKSTNRK